MKKLTKISALTIAMSLTAGSAFATAPWSPKQRHRRQQAHRLNHKIAHQENRAARSFWNGNFAGAFRHAAHAQNMADKQQHIRHQIHRSNRKWERNHVHCPHGYCA